MALNKNNIAVKLTKKNYKKVFDILEMFKQTMSQALYKSLGSGDIDSFHRYAEFHNVKWILVCPDVNKTLVKPRKLKNILAKEYLKEGDVVVLNTPSWGEWVCIIKKIVGAEYHFKSTGEGNKRRGGIYPFSSGRFLRYATEEEKAALNGEKAADPVTHKEVIKDLSGEEPVKELKTGVWYENTYNKKMVVLKRHGDTSPGFCSTADWAEDVRCTSPFQWEIATDTRVSSLLIEEAKKRGLVKGAKVHELTLSGVYSFDNIGLWSKTIESGPIVIFNNGSWAEPAIEQKPEFGIDSFVVGTWYKSNLGSIINYQTDFNSFGFGFGPHGTWIDTKWNIEGTETEWRKATENEVAEALIKEAKKRGFIEGAKVLPMAPGAVVFCILSGKFICNRFQLEGYTQSGSRVVLFQDGKWAVPVEEAKKDSLIHDLDKLRAKEHEDKEGMCYLTKHGAIIPKFLMDYLYEKWNLEARIKQEDKPKSLKIEKGKRYRCVKDLSIGGGWGERWFNSTATYLSEMDGYLTDEKGYSCNIGEFTDWFKEVEKQKVEKEAWLIIYPGGGRSVYLSEPVAHPGQRIIKGTLTYEV